MLHSFEVTERTQRSCVFKMALTIVIVFFLSLFLRASLSLPIALDVKTVQLNSETALTEKAVHETEIILNLEEETKLVQSLTTESVFNAFESIEANHGKRIKRGVIIPLAHCPEDRIAYGNQCLTKEQFLEYSDGSESSDDYKEER